MNERILNYLIARFNFILEWKHFNGVSGIVTIANPLALLPQLWSAVFTDNVDAISITTYVFFACLQALFALIGLKSRNLGMFISMIASITVSIAIIVVISCK